MVFISYTHDSDKHSSDVLQLANRLREKGVDAQIDQYVPFPKEGWPAWMEKQIDAAEFVLIICSDRYFRKSAAQSSAVASGGRWESHLIYHELYDLAMINSKFIPILLNGSDKSTIPKPLRPYTYFNLPGEFEHLYRVLTNQPRAIAPSLGQVEILLPESNRASSVNRNNREDNSAQEEVNYNLELKLDFADSAYDESKKELLLTGLRSLFSDEALTVNHVRKKDAILTQLNLQDSQIEKVKWVVEKGYLDRALKCKIQINGSASDNSTEANPSRNQLIIELAKDLINPLTIIRGYFDLLVYELSQHQAATHEEVQEIIFHIESNIECCAEIVELARKDFWEPSADLMYGDIKPAWNLAKKYFELLRFFLLKDRMAISVEMHEYLGQIDKNIARCSDVIEIASM